MAGGTAAVELTQNQHRTIGRLESFGDIVFGFTLVLMASRLRVPDQPQALVAELPEFAIFLAAFGILSFLWFRHHVILRDLFVPDTLGVVLNFVVLADIAVFAYPLELYFKFGGSSAIALAAYAVVFGVLNLTYGALYIKGLIQRGGHLDDRERDRTIWRTVRVLGLGVALVACAATYSFGLNAMFLTLACIAVPALLGYRVWRTLRPRKL
jgi:uncharacterized membrane protein